MSVPSVTPPSSQTRSRASVAVAAVPYRLVSDHEGLRAALTALAAFPVLGLDVETTGLDPRADRLRLLQVAAPTTVFVVDTWACPTWAAVLAPLFADRGRRFVGHNIGFDLGFLLAAGVEVEAVYDTMLAAQLLDKGQNYPIKGMFSLASVALRTLGESLDKSEQVSDWAGPLSERQLTYAARDAAILLPLRERQLALLAAEGLGRVAGIEMGCVPALAMVEHHGMPFDRDAWATLADLAVEEAVAAQRQADECFIAAFGAKTLFGPLEVGGGKFVGGYDLQLGSPQKVLEVLRDKLGLPLEDSVDDDALQAIADLHPVVPLILQYRDAQKRVSTYGHEWLARFVAADGRVHARYRQLGSRAGRMSAEQPNVQQIPHTSQYRSCFRVKNDQILAKVDYSQIELRVCALVAGDPAMLRAYREGQDLHTLTASRVLGVPVDQITKAHRQTAKSINFGLIYGAGAETLRVYARSTFGVRMSAEQAVRYRNDFFATYPGLKAWHKRLGRDQAPQVETQTLTGRKRLVEKFTQRANTPIQGSAADGLKRALGRLWWHRREMPDTLLVAVVHDEIVAEGAAASARRMAEWVAGHMVAGMVEVVGDGVPIETESTIARDWAGTKLEES